MRYLLKQKIWCLGNDYRVMDEAGRDCFIVDGAAFSFGEKLRFLDLEGNELAFIRERLLSWGPTFEIHREGRLFATVKKQFFTLLHCKFEVDGPGSNDFEAGGDFTDHEYQITAAEGPVAHVSKRWFALSDTYGVEIAEGQDAVLLLATAVVIDLMCHQGKKKH